MFALTKQAFPGGGRCRTAADEAPFKIQFFAKRKSSKTYPIKYFVLHSDCKRIQCDGYLPSVKKILAFRAGTREDFLATLEKQYLIWRLIRHFVPPSPTGEGVVRYANSRL